MIQVARVCCEQDALSEGFRSSSFQLAAQVGQVQNVYRYENDIR